MLRGVLVTAGFVLGVVSGCPGLSPYVCGADADCDRAGEAGRCLGDGACAYPVTGDRCDSGWARSPNAAVAPGQCVPDDGETGSIDGGDAGTGDTEGGSGILETTGEFPACGASARIEIDTAFLSASEVLEGYPLLVSITSPAIVQGIAAAGTDPVVLGPSGDIQPSEVEQLDEAAGTLMMWVRLPSYALGEPLELQLQWGGSQLAPDVAEVWADRYVGVWHLGDELSGIDGDELRNSARLTEPGLTSGQMQPGQSIPGVVGSGLAFDGDDDVVTIDAEFVGQLQSYAITLWVRYDGDPDGPGDYFQRLNGDNFYPRCWRQAGGNVFCQYTVDDAVTSLGGNLDQEVGQLLHLAMVRDADAATHRLYIDGELVNENDDPPGATLPDDGLPFELGHGELGTLPGLLDEVRIADRPLSAAWVRADHRSQLQPQAALERVGDPEPTPCPD